MSQNLGFWARLFGGARCEEAQAKRDELAATQHIAKVRRTGPRCLECWQPGASAIEFLDDDSNTTFLHSCGGRLYRVPNDPSAPRFSIKHHIIELNIEGEPIGSRPHATPAGGTERTQLRDQFMQITAQLKTADPLAQAAVGHGINMMHSFFVKRFGDVNAFQRHSKAENLRFIENLSELEQKLATSDPHTALGVILFKMWIGAVSEKDQELIDEFSAQLATLSRKGESLGGPA